MLDLFEIIKALMHRPHLLLPLGLGAGSTELQILNVIKKADEDSSGQVTKEELMSFLLKNQTGKRGLSGMDQGYKAFDNDFNHKDPVVPKRHFGEPLIVRPATREMGMPSRRFPQNHVCQNEFFTKGESPGENAAVMASGYFKTVGRPFEGEPRIKTTQKPRMMGKGKEWSRRSSPRPTRTPAARKPPTGRRASAPTCEAPPPSPTRHHAAQCRRAWPLSRRAFLAGPGYSAPGCEAHPEVRRRDGRRVGAVTHGLKAPRRRPDDQTANSHGRRTAKHQVAPESR